MKNVEIKARLADPEGARRVAARLSGAEPRHIQQSDTFFRVPDGRLKLRILGAGAGELIRYDRPDVAGPRPSEYDVARTPEPHVLLDILRRTLPVLGTVRKTRLLYQAGQTRIHLDRVEGLGDFLELEVVLEPGQSDADGELIARRLLAEFGVPEQDCIARAYIDLLPGA